MPKETIKGEVYRFQIVQDTRGNCNKCNPQNELYRKENLVLMRFYAPAKKEYKICHKCLIRHMEYIEKRNEQARKREERKQAKIAEREAKKAKRKEKKNGVLPNTVAKVQSKVPAPEKKNGRTGVVGSGAAQQGVTFLSKAKE
jgi:hypothetical protein